MSTLVISTACGEIKLALRPDAAPETVKYISKLVSDGVYNGCTFYRSDFVIQCGLHPHKCPVENLKVNETPLHTKISNTRGTAAIAHWDVPDCGNSEFFINLGSNAHLDSAYGGYCVFAAVDLSDSASTATMDKIAEDVKVKKTVQITKMGLL